MYLSTWISVENSTASTSTGELSLLNIFATWSSPKSPVLTPCSPQQKLITKSPHSKFGGQSPVSGVHGFLAYKKIQRAAKNKYFDARSGALDNVEVCEKKVVEACPATLSKSFPRP
jgi:hypothetical protein